MRTHKGHEYVTVVNDLEEGVVLHVADDRNRENFRNAIYFHLGGLDLYPEALRSTHPKP